MILGWTMFDVDLLWTVSVGTGVGALLAVYIGLEIRGFHKIVPLVVQHRQEFHESEPLVGESIKSGQLESLRLDIVDDPSLILSHKESLRRDVVITGDTTKRRWSYIH